MDRKENIMHRFVFLVVSDLKFNRVKQRKPGIKIEKN
jgi:hypothetical protein